MISRPVRILAGDDGHRGVAIEDVRGVDELPVDAPGECGLGEAGADARSELRHGDGLFEAALAAVWQGDDRHRRWSRSVITMTQCRDRGGRTWDRTTDPYHVKVVLYR